MTRLNQLRLVKIMHLSERKMFSREVNLLSMASITFSSALGSVRIGKNLPGLLFNIFMMKMLQKMFKEKKFFSPNQFYCVETVVAPCGVVIDWTKVDKEEVFPTEESCPAYICIDKACQVMRTAVSTMDLRIIERRLPTLLWIHITTQIIMLM